MGEARYFVKTLKTESATLVRESGPFTLQDAENEADRIAAVGPGHYPAIVERPEGLILSQPLAMEADLVKKEVADLINRLKDIVDDLERAAEHGAEGIATLWEGHFATDHLNWREKRIEVSAFKLGKALDYYQNVRK